MSQPIPVYNGPIAILDMLGFKKYVEQNTLTDIINSYARVITGASFTAEVLKENLQFMVYSDTIAIRLVNLTEKGFYNFIKALQLIAHDFFYLCNESSSIPIRGAIAVGEYSWHNGDISTQAFNRDPITARNVNFIVGKAVLDAHDHETLQNWIGISMSDETAMVLKRNFPGAFASHETEKYLVRYDIPTKTGTHAGYAINPTQRAVFERTFSAYMNRCKIIFEDGNERLDVKVKYFNTLSFLYHLYDNDYLCPFFAGHDRKDFGKGNADKALYDGLVEYYKTRIPILSETGQ